MSPAVRPLRSSSLPEFRTHPISSGNEHRKVVPAWAYWPTAPERGDDGGARLGA